MIAFRTDGRLDHFDPISDLLWDHGCVGILEDRTDLVAYFPSKRPLPLDGRWEQPDDTDYLAAYFASLKPIRLDGLVIAPTHRKVRLTVGEKVLWLDPGMAFGSGHHETTQLALGALAALDLRGRRVLDVGSGSGILAIAADLMGAAQAEGLDIDAATIAVAEANAEMNRSRATFRAGELGCLLCFGKYRHPGSQPLRRASPRTTAAICPGPQPRWSRAADRNLGC